MEVRCPQLVGRESELARLEAMVERVAAGGGEAVVLSGVAGVGKTALVRRIVPVVEDAGGCVVVGRAAPDAAVSLRLLAEVALAALDRGVDLASPDLALYRRAVERLVGDVGAESDSSPDGVPHPLVVADALVRMLDGLTRPVLLVLEDVHWTDPDSLPAFEFFCDQAPARGLGVVATVRSDEPSDVLKVVERLRARRAVEAIELLPLSPDAVKEMLTLCLERTPEPELVDTVVDRSEGRPLVVEELLGVVATKGKLDLDAMGVPATLVESVGARLGQLTDGQRQVVVLAAQLGLDVAVSMLGELSDLGPYDLSTALAAAEMAFLVEVGGGRVRFPHGLTRDAVLGAVPASQLQQVADRAVEALGETIVLDDPHLEAAAALAAHGTRSEGIARLRLEVGRRALLRGALETSQRWLALARDSAGDDYDLRADATALLVESLSHSGHVADAARVGEDAVRMALVRGDPDAQRRVELALIRTDIVAERWQSALDRLHELDSPTARRPDAVVLRSRAELGMGRMKEAATSAGIVVDEAKKSQDVVEPAVLCEAFEVLGRVARGSDLDAAARWFEQGVRTAERAGLRAWRARALHELATIRQLDAGEVDLHVLALEAATDAGAFSVATGVLFHLGALHGVQFEADRALEEGRRGLDLARRLGTARQAAMAWIIIGQAHASAGREPQARAAASEAVALAPGDPEIGGLAGGACTALALVVNERRVEAVDELSRAVAMLEQVPAKTPVSTWYLWPLLNAVAGDGAADALAVTDVPELRVARGFNALWLLAAAVDAGRRGDDTGAASSLQESLQHFDRCPGFIGYRHLGLRLAAEAALDDGWANPAPWLTEAAQWFEAKGLTRPAQAARSLASRAGVPISRRRGPPVPESLAAMGITRREVDVLTLVGEGLTNREIGEKLYISPRTVKSHVEHLLTKTGSTNRAQLAALAAQQSVL